MAKTKERLLFLLKSLMNTADGTSEYTLNDLQALYQENGTPATQKTITNDIEKLIDSGFPIETIKSPGKPNIYTYSLTFDTPEIKMIIDAVAAAKFISPAKCDELIQKLMTLTTGQAREDLQKSTDIGRHNETPNTGFFITIMNISKAIEAKKKISYQYYDYDLKKRKVLHNNGETYIYSPYAFAWNEDRYYLLGRVDKRPDVINPVRVDLITNVHQLEEDILPPPDDFAGGQYSEKVFKMFSGEEASVTLEADNSLVKTFIDRFGKGFRIERASDSTFHATVDVSVSPTFFSWVFQFNGQIQIIGPDSIRNQYSDMLRRLSAYYENLNATVDER